MYDDVLLPFDGSDGAAAVLQHTADLAEGFDATVHVLFVADTTRDSVTVVEGQTVDALAERGEDIVGEAERTLRAAGVDYDSDVVQGNPAPMIAEYAEQYGYDLVVMPTHGRRGVSRYLAGSVTEKVVRLSSVPVLTARMQDDERLAFPYENVLIPADGSAGAIRAAKHGFALADALDATVHALSVVDTAFAGYDVRSPSAGEAAANDALDELEMAAAEHGIDSVVRHVDQGGPVDCIRDCIKTADIDAVVMGTTGRRGADRILLGSVAEKTGRSAPVPVITVGGPDNA
ncbi:universal stress protein [Salarchaeum japonicum]|uniref:universal stress protein n=1 Tax=Salarchaeum japonicum TaxID=555573 RepID=UPI003C77888B